MKATIQIADYKRIIKATKKFVAENYSNPIMKHVHISVEGGILTAEALDGHKIARERAKCECNEAFECYIKPINFQYMTSSSVDIELENDYAYVTCGDFRIGFKQPEGMWYKEPCNEYLDKSKYQHHIVKFKTKLLKETIDSINSEYVQLRFGDNRLAPMYVSDDKNECNSTRMLLPVNGGN